MQTWQQQVFEIYSTHKAYQRAKGEKKAGRGQTGWSMRDTAKLMNLTQSIVCESIAIVEESRTNPEIMQVAEFSIARQRVRQNKRVAQEKRIAEYYGS